MPTVLVVDDESEIRASLRGVLNDEGLRVLEAENGRSALDLVRRERPDLVLLDVWMPEIDGIELLHLLRGEPGRPEVVMISGHGSIETAVRATKLGAFDFIEKPFSIEALLHVVERALEHRAALTEAGSAEETAMPSAGGTIRGAVSGSFATTRADDRAAPSSAAGMVCTRGSSPVSSCTRFRRGAASCSPACPVRRASRLTSTTSTRPATPRPCTDRG